MVPTSGLSFAVNKWVAERRICVEPQPSTTFSVLTPNFLQMPSVRSPALQAYRPARAPVGVRVARTASSTVLLGPIGFSLLARQMTFGSRAWSEGSSIDHTLCSMLEPSLQALE